MWVDRAVLKLEVSLGTESARVARDSVLLATHRDRLLSVPADGSSEVLHVFDQGGLISVAQLVAVVVTLVLDEVRTNTHFQHLLQEGGLSFRGVDGAELVELVFRVPSASLAKC